MPKLIAFGNENDKSSVRDSELQCGLDANGKPMDPSCRMSDASSVLQLPKLIRYPGLDPRQHVRVWCICGDQPRNQFRSDSGRSGPADTAISIHILNWSWITADKLTCCVACASAATPLNRCPRCRTSNMAFRPLKMVHRRNISWRTQRFYPQAGSGAGHQGGTSG